MPALHGFTLLKGVEVDILEDGALDLPDSILSRLDLVVAAVHSHFELPREAQTRRIIRAMDNPHVSIIAHPTGRLIGRRAPYDLDFGQIAAAAAERGCRLEINAAPDRLDLDDVHAYAARAVPCYATPYPQCRKKFSHSLRVSVAQHATMATSKSDLVRACTLRR